jgi:hypothetical protein
VVVQEEVVEEPQLQQLALAVTLLQQLLSQYYLHPYLVMVTVSLTLVDVVQSWTN